MTRKSIRRSIQRLLRHFRQLLPLLLLAGSAVAAELVVAEEFTAEPGHFLSIPVNASEGTELTIDAPPYLRLLGAPQLRAGRALVNLLVEHDAPSGITPLTVRLRAEGHVVAQATVRINVGERVTFDLIVPEGGEAVAGDTVEYSLIVTNTGNSSDSYRFSANSGLRTRFTPAVLELAAGERGQVTLQLEANGRQLDTLILWVQSVQNPDLRQSRAITTSVLPFAGAGTLDGPALGYELTAAASVGSQGFDYLLGARLSGDLSEFVQVDSNLRYHQGSLSGALALGGEDWRVGYQGFTSLQQLEARYHRIQGFLSVPRSRAGFTTGLSYTDEPLAISLTHTSADNQSDTFRVSYTLNPHASLQVTPSLGLRGYGNYGADYSVGVLLGLRLQLQTDALNASANVSMTLPHEPSAPWSVAATISNRVQTKFGITGDLGIAPRQFHVGITARELLTPELTFSQSLRYQQSADKPSSFSVRAALSFQPEAGRYQVRTSVDAIWRAEQLHLGYSAGVTYQPGNWQLELQVRQLEEFQLDAAAAYKFDDFAVRSTFRHQPASSRLLLGAGRQAGDFQGGILAGYDFHKESFAAELDLAYQFTRNFGTYGSAAYDAGDFQFRVGANVKFSSGFATPDGVVDLFGGRAVGWIEGRVFHDANRNGQFDAAETTYGGVTVNAAGVSAVADEDGWYRFAVPPGSYQVTLSSLNAGFALVTPPKVDVTINETITLDLPLQEVAGLTGFVFDDEDRSGNATGRKSLPYARIILERANGQRFLTRADDRGLFHYQNLMPGNYTIFLDASSLPQHHEVTTAPQQLQLQIGPFPRVNLGATAQVRTRLETFVAGDLTMTVRTEPNQAPAGADLRVIAEVEGEPSEVFGRLAGSEFPLLPVTAGRYEATVSLPDTAGVANLEVIARDGNREVTRALMLLLQPGPLARLNVKPVLLEADEEALITAVFLTLVDEAFVLLEGERIDLVPQDAYTFTATLKAPLKAGSYQLRLWGDGEEFAMARIRVEE